MHIEMAHGTGARPAFRFPDWTARRGPIVMNTQEELQLAFDEYDRGTFLNHGKK